MTSQTKRCLVLIDLQNEFLAPSGHFPIRENPDAFTSRLPCVVETFRNSGYPVIWIRSEYGTIVFGPDHEVHQAPYLERTHLGAKPCCSPNTFGAAFPPSIEALISRTVDHNDIVITKNWYSAFKDTDLKQYLDAHAITDVFVGGVVTNVCVSATTLAALRLGLNVTLIEDCIGWRNRTSHDKAMRDLAQAGAKVTESARLTGLDTGTPDYEAVMTDALPTLYYVNGSIPSWRVMMALHEKRMAFKPIRLFVMTEPKETRLPDFLALNHRGKTPVFVDNVATEGEAPATSGALVTAESGATSNQIIINESLAILLYLETYHVLERPLLPPIQERAARARSLARIQETENLRLIYDTLEDTYFDAQHEGTSMPCTERLQLIESVDKELDYWEVYASENTYIAGPDFGLADCAFFPILAYMVHRGFEWKRRSPNGMWIGAWPKLKQYYENIWTRGGLRGCARRAQPHGWDRNGKVNLWKGTRGGAKGLYERHKSPQ